MKKKVSIAVFILILLTSIIYIACLNLAKCDSVVVLSSSSFTDSIGDYHVVGEVQNLGSGTVDYVQITATFYDSNNKVVDTDFTYSSLSYMQPNDKSPFDIIDIHPTIVPTIDHYNLQVSLMQSGSIQQGLQILSNSSYTDSIGYLHVVGEIQNQGAATSSYNKISATFYDSSGKVVDTDFAFTNPTDVAAGGKAPFEIILIDSSRVPMVASYSLMVQSNTYAQISINSAQSATPTATASPIPTSSPTATSPPTVSTPSSTPVIPEFPTALMIIIGMSAFSVATLAAKKHVTCK